MKINEFVKQNISDSEFQSLKELIDPISLAYTYVVFGSAQTTLDVVLKAHYNEKVLTPYLREYICMKEKYMGKSRLLFTDEERNETIKELEDLYHTLKSKRIVY